MPQSTIPITVQFLATASFTAQAPTQRQFQLDFTNPTYARNATLTQDCITVSYYTCSVQIPLSNLYQVATEVQPGLSWPPIITLQPTSSNLVHTASGQFALSASSFTTYNVQWYSQSYQQSLTSSAFYPLTNSSVYSGVSTNLLTYLTSSTGTTGSSYYAIVSNTSGQATTNTVQFFIS